MRSIPHAAMCAALLTAVLYVQHAQADGTPAPAAATASDGQEPAETLVLGDIQVTGQKEIVKTLQAIKTALKQPLSTDKAHENDVVCRISNETGSHARNYLVCATNKQLTHQRYMAQMEMMEDEARTLDGGSVLENITARQSLHRLSMPVNAQAFEQLLQSLPDATPDEAQAPAGVSVKPVPAVSTQAAPAASTGPQTH